ncbi:testis-expressed protein 33 [Ornithorhynchus anatinus]|uniref:testis-expressed protein 33 n=1 Tax=Ornithorhynchus anatinus TaxID=9258 RepID=UPI0010A7C137|nr:testis-expressed protein 33 [Ornithorhynchus anatinus]
MKEPVAKELAGTSQTCTAHPKRGGSRRLHPSPGNANQAWTSPGSRRSSRATWKSPASPPVHTARPVATPSPLPSSRRSIRRASQTSSSWPRRSSQPEGLPASSKTSPPRKETTPRGSRTKWSPQPHAKPDQVDLSKKQKEATPSSRPGTPKSEGEEGREQKARGRAVGRKRSSLLPRSVTQQAGNSAMEQLNYKEQAWQVLNQVSEGQRRMGNILPNVTLNQSDTSKCGAYHDLSYSIRSDLFPGPPMELRSLMMDSYTPDVFERAVRDLSNWHGRKTDDLGRWHRKNALDRNLQKALEQRFGDRRKVSKSA